MVPGTSRSGATIICGRLLGLSRQAATEFLLAMPTIVGAAACSGCKYRKLFQPFDLPMSALGFVVSFIFAMIDVREFVVTRFFFFCISKRSIQTSVTVARPLVSKYFEAECPVFLLKFDWDALCTENKIQ